MDPLVSEHPIIGSVVVCQLWILCLDIMLGCYIQSPLHILIFDPPNAGQMFGIHSSWP